MKTPSDRDHLLDEIMGDAAPPDFRAALLEQTLRAVRRRTTIRRARRVLLTVAVLVSLPLGLWKLTSPARRETVSSPAAYELVRSQPLDPSKVVATQPDAVPVVASRAGLVALVETRSDEKLFREIDDQQLLSLLAGRPAILVRPAPQQADLIFVNPDDARGFPLP
jgi:hypothetical protein